MNIYAYLMGFSAIPIVYVLTNHLKSKRRIFVIMVGSILFLLMVLTPINVRADYNIYSEGYRYISGLSFKNLCDGFHLIKRFDLPWPYSYESGFVVFQWMSAKAGLDYFAWTVLYEAICIVVTSSFIYKYSSRGWISYLIWMAFYFYSIAGRFRQSLALILLITSLKYVQEKKLWMFLLMIYAAFLFHQSAFIFMPLYFIGNIQLNKKRYLKMLVVIPVVSCLMANYFLATVIGGFGYTEMAHALSFSLNKRMLLVFAFCILAVFKTDFRTVKDDKDKLLIYWGILLTFGMTIIGAYEQLVSRAVEYYFIFFLLLIPDLFSYYKKRIQYLANFALYALLLIYFYTEMNSSGFVG